MIGCIKYMTKWVLGRVQGKKKCITDKKCWWRNPDVQKANEERKPNSKEWQKNMI